MTSEGVCEMILKSLKSLVYRWKDAGNFECIEDDSLTDFEMAERVLEER